MPALPAMCRQNFFNFKPRFVRSVAAVLLFAMPALPGFAREQTDVRESLDACNVTWNEPGPTSAESMPLGNGDIGLNVWVEPSGDLLFYIGKSDSWDEDVRSDHGLMKLGKIRVSAKPNMFAAGAKFSQMLKLQDGEIQVDEGSGTEAIHFRVWVDANHPAIHVEAKSDGQPVSLAVALEDWRLSQRNPDVILPNQTNQIVWYHRNGLSAQHVSNLTFGGVIEGKGFVSTNAAMLESSSPAKTQVVSVYPLTAATATPDEWVSKAEAQAKQLESVKLERARAEHQKWWSQFWHRSWIFVSGDHHADEVSHAYILQRFVTACAGRGAYPIKFNGSLFVVDDPALPQGNGRAPRAVTADYRTWGGQYWFQNTRAMYWPCLEAGDFEMMLPLFKMYSAMLPANAAQVREYYHHGGAYFAETAPFWGGLRYWGPEVKEDWTGHYFTPILELSMMMFDYYEFTGDKKFAKEMLVPVASAGVQFFNEHFGRDDQGKILLDPDNAIEMYWKVHDPAPDIAGLRAILPRLIALPDDLVTASNRVAWQKMLGEIPELPVGTRDGKTALLPYTGPQTARFRNGENPELYAVYPFRLYGIGEPDLNLAIDTFNTRRMTQMGCWVQDPIQAAMLGLTDVARKYTTYDLTNKEPRLKFPVFWAKKNDYAPDEDDGGNGQHALQEMLMLTQGSKIFLLPAWPQGWDADFKLNAPFETTVEGRVQNGKVVNLVVTPKKRAADVVDMSAH
jgi:hypothetical protein